MKKNLKEIKLKKIANIVLNDFTNDSRVWKTSDSLNKMGFKAEVVALHRLGLKEIENKEGVSVKRIKILTLKLPKLIFAKYIKFFEFSLIVIWQYRNYDFIHCNDLQALPIGLAIRFFSKKKVKVIYDSHEYQTERKNIKSFEKFLFKFLERNLIRFADSVITVSESIANEYTRLYKIPKPQLVLNCPSYVKQKKHDFFREKFSIDLRQSIFLYQGGLFPGRDIEVLIDVFSQYKDDENIIIFMGYGPLEGMIKDLSKKSKNIFFHSSVDINVLLSYTGSADYGIALVDDTCLNHEYCLPNKIFEYLNAGIPIIASNRFEMKKLIQQTGIGVTTSNNSKDELRKSINLIKEMDYKILQKNIKNASKIYNWEEQEKVLKKVYANM